MASTGILIKVILLALAAMTFAMSTTRYSKGVPEGAVVISTREELNDFAGHHLSSALFHRDGGLQMIDMDRTVLAVVADELLPELEAVIEQQKAEIAKRKLEGDYDAEEEEELEEEEIGDDEDAIFERMRIEWDKLTDAQKLGEIDNGAAAKRDEAGAEGTQGCSFPRCFHHSHCRTFNDCHICGTGTKKCM
jgi:hypothetical protein